MKTFCTLLFSLGVISNSIGSSSQSERSSDESRHSASSSSTTEPTARERSRSPTLKQTFPSILGYEFEDLELIRLFPYKNPDKIFELRKYVFPPDKPIQMKSTGNFLTPMPAGERIVLSALNGDVCAILDKTLSRHTNLRPMFSIGTRTLKRVKININSGMVENLTKKEIADCPASREKQVAKSYGVLRLSSQLRNPPDDIHIPGAHDDEASSSFSGRHRPDKTQYLATSEYPARSSPPAESRVQEGFNHPTLRKAYKNVLGYKFDDLAFIRLRPHNNTELVFQFQRYVFPPDKPIGLKKHNGVLEPMPTGDQLVLSTTDGEICAILLKLSNRSKYLRPMFTSKLGVLERVKIDISRGVVRSMTEEEIAECPVTAGEPITQKYEVSRL